MVYLLLTLCRNPSDLQHLCRYINSKSRGGDFLPCVPHRDLIPNLKGKGLKDAIYALENNGFKCSYQGIGHVASQTPAAGTTCQAGSTIQITLK